MLIHLALVSTDIIIIGAGRARYLSRAGYNMNRVMVAAFVGQVWNAEDPGEEVLAMVVRTGLNTTMGDMVRQILSPAFAPAERHPFVQVTLLDKSV